MKFRPKGHLEVSDPEKLLITSENGLIASEFAVDNPVALVRDDCRNDRTKVKVVQLY